MMKRDIADLLMDSGSDPPTPRPRPPQPPPPPSPPPPSPGPTFTPTCTPTLTPTHPDTPATPPPAFSPSSSSPISSTGDFGVSEWRPGPAPLFEEEGSDSLLRHMEFGWTDAELAVLDAQEAERAAGVVRAREAYREHWNNLTREELTKMDNSLSASMVCYWRERSERFRVMEREVAACDGQVEWRLAPLRIWPSYWARSQVRALVAEGYVNRYYFGITWRPAHRWRNGEYGHKHWHVGQYQKMWVLALSDDCEHIVRAERESIGYFTRSAAGGFIEEGGALCQNENPGGEGGTRYGPPPYALYVVVRWNPREDPGSPPSQSETPQ